MQLVQVGIRIMRGWFLVINFICVETIPELTLLLCAVELKLQTLDFPKVVNT